MQSNSGCSVNYEQELLKIERVKYNHAHLEECKSILDGYLYLRKQTVEKEGPEIFIKGEDKVMCGETARFEANVKKANLSCWQITWEIEKHTETVKKCIDTSTEKYSDSTKEILNIKSVCKEDEGKYQAVLSGESNGNEYIVSSNKICLHVMEGALHQVEVVCKIHRDPFLHESSLKLYLHYLIKNLKNPDETWTKEKILQHIEDTMCELEDNNEIDLLHNFFKTLSTDKHISKTLMKCGEDFVAMLFSFQQRHKARNISMSEGSLCVTFCFVNDLNLETFMQKLADNDGQLKKDFSRLILNKTLLKIFNIDPQLVWWTASTAKIYQGLQCLKKVFEKPIEGHSEDFFTEEEETFRDVENEEVKIGMESIKSYVKAKEYFQKIFAPERMKVINELIKVRDDIQKEARIQKTGSITYSSVGIVGGGLVIAGIIAAPFTFGGSLALTVTGVVAASYSGFKGKMVLSKLVDAQTSLQEHDKSCLKMSTLLVPLKRDIDRLRDEIIANQQSRSEHDNDPETRNATRIVHGVKTIVRSLRNVNVKDLASNSKFFSKLLKMGNTIEDVLFPSVSTAAEGAAKIRTKDLGTMTAVEILTELVASISDAVDLPKIEKGKLCDKAEKLDILITTMQNQYADLSKCFE